MAYEEYISQVFYTAKNFNSKNYSNISKIVNTFTRFNVLLVNLV